jgi:hypothetical protein
MFNCYRRLHGIALGCIAWRPRFILDAFEWIIEQIPFADCYIDMIFAQTPTHYPTGSYPMEFTAVNILVYMVFPLLLFVLWILVRRSQRKKNSGENPAENRE